MHVVNPYTEETTDIVETTNLQVLFDRAATKGSVWSTQDVGQRVSALRSALVQCERLREELAECITQEMGKPISKSLAELDRAFEEWRFMLDNAEDFLAPEELLGATVYYEPLGVVAIIAPWNFPVMLPLRGIVPALVAGNSVICKPSELAPQSALRVCEVLQSVAPVEVAIGGKELGARVVELPVSAIAFTGSTEVGKRIAEVAARNLKRVNLELGGLDPAIVFSDADIEHAAEEIVRNNAANSGQTCNAVKRVFVHKAVYEEFVERAYTVARRLIYGDPRDKTTEVGPLVSAIQRKRVQRYLDDAVAKGAVVRQVTPDVSCGYFFPQTILTEVSDTSLLLHEEPFGPLLPIMPFSNVEEVIVRANATSFGLSASVWTKNTTLAHDVASRLVCGLVRINAHGALGPGIPWGGSKQSGMGRMKTKEGLREFVNVKAVA